MSKDIGLKHLSFESEQQQAVLKVSSRVFVGDEAGVVQKGEWKVVLLVKSLSLNTSLGNQIVKRTLL